MAVVLMDLDGPPVPVPAGDPGPVDGDGGATVHRGHHGHGVAVLSALELGVWEQRRIY